MGATIRYASWVMVVVAVATTVAAWFGAAPDLDAADAAEVAIASLDSVGRDGLVVATPERGVHETEGGEEIDAWFLDVALDDETIEMRVRTDAGLLVYIDDTAADGVGQVLTAEEFAGLDAFRDDTVRDRWLRRNGAGSIAALLIAGPGIALGRRNPDHTTPDPSPEDLTA